MSPSWREQVRIWIAPGRVLMVRYGRGWKPAIKDRKAATCAGSGWPAAVEALREVLAHPNVEPAGATVVLSNHFVRYLLIPWDQSLAGPDEEMAFARARFVQVFGEAASKWAVRLSGGTTGKARVAAAVERPLLDALTTQIASSPLKLRSIQPHLMTVFNASRAMIPKDAWISIAEPGRLLLGLLLGGQWHSLRARPQNDDIAALEEMLDQERLLLGLEPGNEKMFRLAADAANPDTVDPTVGRLSLVESPAVGGLR